MGIEILDIKHISSRRGPFGDKLRNTFLIIDEANVAAQLQKEVSESSEILGGNYDLHGWQLKQFFLTLKSCNIIPIVVMEGMQVYLNVWTNNDSRMELPGHAKSAVNPILWPYVIYNITRSMGIRVVRTVDETDNTVAALAKAYDCPVLSSDNDFYFYGVKFIPYQSVSHQSTQCPGGRYLSCRIYHIDELLEKYNGLKSSLLPLALELLQRHNITSKVFQSFFNNITVDERLPDTLIWLSKFQSLGQAVAGVLKYISIDEKETVLGNFEKKIYEYATIPSEILPFLELHDTKVDYLQKRIHEQRLQFQQCPDMPRGQRHLSSEEHNTSMDRVTKIEISREMLITGAPEWWCRDFVLSGLPKGIIMKLFIHFRRRSRFKKDDQFHGAHETSIPVITRLSELIISSMENKKYVLNLPIKNGKNKVRSIRLQRWPIDLSDFRKSEVTKRIHVVNETLGIQYGEILQQLPENWRLYIATIIYWMKQKCEIEKTNVHGFSLLFTMLFGIIDEKIGFYRRIGNGKTTLQGKCRAINEHKAYDCLNVTKEECIAAVEVFRLHSTMLDVEFARALKAGCTSFDGNFWTFQMCLQRTFQLNALLDCPYVPPPIQELYSGTLLYNVFTKFSEAENIDECVEKILKKSPALIGIFKLLKNTVSKELNESTKEK